MALVLPHIHFQITARFGEKLYMVGYSTKDKPEPIIYLPNVYHIHLFTLHSQRNIFDESSELCNLPINLRKLTFGCKYDYPLDQLPQNVTHLTFEHTYSHPISSQITSLVMYKSSSVITLTSDMNLLALHVNIKQLSIPITVHINKICFIYGCDIPNDPPIFKTSVMYYLLNHDGLLLNTIGIRYKGYLTNLSVRVDINKHNTAIKQRPFYELSD